MRRFLISLVVIVGALPGQLDSQELRPVQRRAPDADSIVNASIRLLEELYASTASCRMQTYQWQSVLTDRLPANWRRVVEGADRVTDVHFATWSAGRLAGICYHPATVEQAAYSTAVYYDGVRTAMKMPRADTLGVKRGFHSGAVSIWPHSLFGIQGGVPLGGTLRLAASEGRLQVTKEGDRCVLSITGDDRITRITVGLQPSLHLAQIRYDLPNGTPSLVLELSAWQDEGRRWPTEAVVRHGIVEEALGVKNGADPEKGRDVWDVGHLGFVDQHVRMQWRDGAMLTGARLVSHFTRCVAVSYEGKRLATPGGYDSLLRTEYTKLRVEYPGLPPVGGPVPELVVLPSASEIELLWRQPPEAPSGRPWPSISPEVLGERRITIGRLSKEHCAQGSLAMLLATQGAKVEFSSLYELAPEGLISLQETIDLAKRFGGTLVPVRLTHIESFRLSRPFLVHENKGPVGHLSLGIPINESAQGVWRFLGQLVRKNPEHQGDLVSTYLIQPEDAASLQRGGLWQRWMLGGLAFACVIGLILLLRRVRSPSATILVAMLGALFVSCEARGNQVEISVSPNAFDIEFDRLNSSKVASVLVENKGGAAIRLQLIGPACGCLSIEKGLVNVPPGETGKLGFTVNGSSMGRQNSSLQVITSKGRPIATIPIQITVWGKIYSKPQSPTLVLDSSASVVEDAMEVVVNRTPAEDCGLKIECEDDRVIPYVGSTKTTRTRYGSQDTFQIAFAVKDGAKGLISTIVRFRHENNAAQEPEEDVLRVPLSILIGGGPR